MTGIERKRVSFPITVWYEPESGEIRLLKPTDNGFCTSVSADADCANGHPDLFRELRRALRERGVGFAEPPAKFN